MTGRKTYDVFLSYNSYDKTNVFHLAEKLEKAKLTHFLDEWFLVPGEPWQEGLDLPRGHAGRRTGGIDGSLSLESSTPRTMLQIKRVSMRKDTRFAWSGNFSRFTLFCLFLLLAAAPVFATGHIFWAIQQVSPKG